MKEHDPELSDLSGNDIDLDEAVGPIGPPRRAVVEEEGPQVPLPYERPPDIDRRIRGSVDRMLEEVQNPYEVVIIAAQEARRLNERKLKARSILNQAADHVEELLPEVPFMPHPVEDDEPEVKPTNEALERLALGLVEYEIDDQLKQGPSFYGGEIDFPLVRERKDDEGPVAPESA